MITSGVPPGRLSSFINCTNGSGITCGKSYYTLINLNEEKYQLTVPVTWSTNSTTNIEHVYECTARFGGKGGSIISLMMNTDFIGGSMLASIKGNIKYLFCTYD